jgi:hypothetical protein
MKAYETINVIFLLQAILLMAVAYTHHSIDQSTTSVQLMLLTRTSPGRHFTVFSDHKPLERSGKKHERTTSRIQESFMQWDFEIKYKKGCEMPADKTGLQQVLFVKKLIKASKKLQC